MDHSPHGTGLIVFAAIILFSLYRRFRSHVGRQPVQPRSMMFRLVFLCIGALAVLLVPHLAPYARIEEAAGLAAGAGLAWWGLQMTHFSADSTQRYYTPNTWLGLAITAVFIGRIAYRFLVLAPVANGEPALASRMTPQMILMGSQSGLTVALFGLVAGYYVAYYAGVLLRSRGIAFITEPAVSGPG